jgi:hypothetical protein
MSSIDFTQGTLQSLLFHTITGRNYNHRLQWLVVGYGIYITLSKYFSYIVVVSFIGGGKQSTWRKPPTCRKALKNIIT